MVERKNKDTTGTRCIFTAQAAVDTTRSGSPGLGALGGVIAPLPEVLDAQNVHSSAQFSALGFQGTLLLDN